MKTQKSNIISFVLILSALAGLAALDFLGALKIQDTDNHISHLENNIAGQDGKVGAAPTFTAGKLYTLYGSGVSSTDTSIKLTSFQTPVSNIPIQTTDLINGATNKFYATIEPTTNRKETVGCTGVTQNSDGTALLTGCTRGYTFTYPYTASTTLQLSHSGGSRLVLSDSPQLYNDIITYVNSITAAGVVDSSATVKGILEKALASEAASHAAIGSGDTTAPLALTTDIASSSRVANSPVIVVASSTTGFIDNSFIASSTVLYPAIIPSQTTNGTTTMATTTINGFVPWGVLAGTNATNTSKITLTCPARNHLRIEAVASTTDNGGTYIRFNSLSGPAYVKASPGGSSNVSTTSIRVNTRDSTRVLEYYVIDIMNIPSENKLINISYISTSGVGDVLATTTAAMLFQASSTPITSMDIIPYTGSGPGNTFTPSATSARCYGSVDFPNF